MEWFTTWHRGDQLVFDGRQRHTHESVQPACATSRSCRSPDSPPPRPATRKIPLARAQALVQALSAELERLRAAR